MGGLPQDPLPVKYTQVDATAGFPELHGKRVGGGLEHPGLARAASCLAIRALRNTTEGVR
jgi:hypothetical protein